MTVVESTAESALIPLLLKNTLHRTGPFMHSYFVIAHCFPEFKVYVFLIVCVQYIPI
jgi:hypothetical protein